MKVKVIKKFRDKTNSYKIIEVGQEIEVAKERFEELTTSPLGVFVEEIKKETKKK